MIFKAALNLITDCNKLYNKLIYMGWIKTFYDFLHIIEECAIEKFAYSVMVELRTCVAIVE